MDEPSTPNLESQSLWYKYKSQIWLEESPQTAVVHNIMRVLRAIRNSGPLAYVSVPITSGRFLYNLKMERPEMDKKSQIELAINHNYQLGWELLEAIRKRRNCPVLYPADLTPVHQEWEQAHFQALWLSIIAEKCTEVHMSDGWYLSNGGSEEFVHVWQLKLGLPKHKSLIFYNTKEDEKSERERMRNIVVYNHLGSPMTIEDGMELLERSISWLEERGFKAGIRNNSLRLLKDTEHMLKAGFYK